MVSQYVVYYEFVWDDCILSDGRTQSVLIEETSAYNHFMTRIPMNNNDLNKRNRMEYVTVFEANYY